MSKGIGVQLWKAHHIVREVIALLSPYCEVIEVAGSVRRGSKIVGDIDLVAVPKFEVKLLQSGLFPSDNLYGDPDDLLASFIHGLDDEFNSSIGSSTHVFYYEGVKIEVYTVDHVEKFPILKMIRTGPHEFSKGMVTLALYRHYHVVDHLLHLHEKSGKTGNRKPCKKGLQCVAVQALGNEEELFKALVMPYILPEARCLEFLNELVSDGIGVQL